MLRAVAKDLGSSLMGRWRRDGRPFPLLTEALADHGFPDISGDLFVERIAGLCTSDGGTHTFGGFRSRLPRLMGHHRLARWPSSSVNYWLVAYA
jgi:hypothetical protein